MCQLCQQHVGNQGKLATVAIERTRAAVNPAHFLEQIQLMRQNRMACFIVTGDEFEDAGKLIVATLATMGLGKPQVFGATVQDEDGPKNAEEGIAIYVAYLPTTEDLASGIIPTLALAWNQAVWHVREVLDIFKADARVRFSHTDYDETVQALDQRHMLMPARVVYECEPAASEAA